MDFCYNAAPITKISTLARILRIEESALLELADRASACYKIGSREKKADGTFRITFDAKKPLKSIQARIQCLILRNITYPCYLHGGIRDPQNPRDYVSSARTHQSSRWLVCEDIRSFFPSVRPEVIQGIWVGLCHFSPEVAGCLTKLTTKDDCLPQGAKTSTALANLVFWRDEPALFRYLRARGINYSRLVDDINCSSFNRLRGSELTDTVRRLHAMCAKYGLSIKRQKHAVFVSGGTMKTTNLVVNSLVSLPHEERSSIRRQVRQLEVTAEVAANRSTVLYAKNYNSLSGKVGKLKRFHPTEGNNLRRRLRVILPPKV